MPTVPMTSLKKSYPNAKFDYEVLKSAVVVLEQLIEADMTAPVGKPDIFRSVNYGGEQWSYGTDEEFAADYRKVGSTAHFRFSQTVATVATAESFVMSLFWDDHSTHVEVTARTRADVLKVIVLFDAKIKDATLPTPAVPPAQPQKPRVFIGHGRANDWQTLLIELQKHDIEVMTFETGARAGHAIRDVLMSQQVDLAVLVLTAEDEQGDGALRARQNVVHEVACSRDGSGGIGRSCSLSRTPNSSRTSTESSI